MTGDRLDDRGSRLKYLLTEVGLVVWAVTERQLLPWQKLLKLLLKGRWGNCSRLWDLGQGCLDWKGLSLDWWRHEALRWGKLPILLLKLLKLVLILHQGVTGGRDQLGLTEVLLKLLI